MGLQIGAFAPLTIPAEQGMAALLPVGQKFPPVHPAMEKAEEGKLGAEPAGTTVHTALPPEE